MLGTLLSPWTRSKKVERNFQTHICDYPKKKLSRACRVRWSSRCSSHLRFMNFTGYSGFPLSQKSIHVGNATSSLVFICILTKSLQFDWTRVNIAIIALIEITSWLVSAYDFYSRVVKDR